MQTIVKDEVDAINTALEDRIGQHKYRVWFKNSTRMSLVDGYLKVGVPNMFMGNWLENHFSGDISHAVQQATGTECKILFNIEPELAGGQRKTQLNFQAKQVNLEQNASVRSRIKPLLAPAKAMLKLSLDSFVVGGGNELAYNAAKSVVSNSKSPYNPLFFHGGYGIGKTHLLQGICNEMSRLKPQAKWIYVSAEDFTNQFILGMKTKKLEAFRDRFRNADLLAIDDIHFLASKPSTQEEFLHTFNTIDMAGKQIVLASDAHPKMIGKLCDKLVNRFVSGMVIKIDTPDVETRFEICKNRLIIMKKSFPDNIVRFVSENIKTNIRELEGALLKLIAYSALNDEKISLADARNLLSEHISRTDPIVHISDIEAATSTFFGITTADIHSSRKDGTVSTARAFSMYLARKYTKMSYPEIGRLMGNKNHATVILACRKVDDMVTRNLDVNWRTSVGNRLMKAQLIIEKLIAVVAG